MRISRTQKESPRADTQSLKAILGDLTLMLAIIGALDVDGSKRSGWVGFPDSYCRVLETTPMALILHSLIFFIVKWRCVLFSIPV